MIQILRNAACLILALGLFACGMGDEDPPSSYLRVLNSSPGLNRADVLVDNVVVVEDLAYSLETPYMPVDAGGVNIKINPANSPTAVVDFSPSLEENSDYTLIVIDEASTVETVLVKDDNTPPPMGMGKIQVIHADPNATGVDVYITSPGADLNAVAHTLTDFTFKEVSDYIELPQGLYQTRAAATGTKEPILIDLGNSTVNEGDILTTVILDAPTGG